VKKKTIRKFLKKTIGFSLIILLVIAPGCAGLFNIKDIRGDALDEGFTSIVLIRIKIADRTNVFFERLPQILLVSRRDGNPTIDWISSYKNEQWIKKDVVSYYDRLIIAEARPSDYLIASCILTAGNYNINIELEKKGLNFSVKPGEIMCLGTLDVTIFGLEVTGSNTAGRTFTYNYSALMKNSRDEEKNDLAEFKNRYPRVYKNYSEKINSVKWK